MPKPQGKITDLVPTHRIHYQRAFNQMQETMQIYMGDFRQILGNDVPSDVKIHKSGKGRNIIDGFRNQIRTDEPTVDFAAAGADKVSQGNASLMKRWGYGQLRKQRQRSEIDPDSQTALDLLLRGAACQKILLSTDQMAGRAPKGVNTLDFKNWELRDKSMWPFVILNPDPLNLFPPPGLHKPLRYMIETQERRVADMWAEYPQWPDPVASLSKTSQKDRHNPARSVRWVEYWSVPEYDSEGVMTDPGWYIVEADGAIVIDKPNPYGFVPYIYEWSGLGRRDGSGDPLYEAVNILTGISGELAGLVEVLTAMSVQTMMHVFPILLTTEDPRKVASQFSVGPARVVQHPPGNPPKYMERPDPNENLFRHYDLLDQEVSKLANIALAGGRQPGVDFGVLQAMQIGQALKAISPVRQTLDRVGSQKLNMMAMLSERFDLNTTVEGTSESAERSRIVKSEDFKHFNFQVTFEAVDPAENNQALLVGESLRRAGDLSQRTFWRVYAKHVVPDADEEEANLLAEQIINHPAFIEQLVRFTLEEASGQDLLDAAQTAIQDTGRQIQNRVDDTLPQVSGQRARDLEGLANTPGSLNIPLEVAQEAGREARG